MIFSLIIFFNWWDLDIKELIAMYEKSNLGWRFYLLQKRLQEWWELKAIQVARGVEEVPLFAWLDSEVVKFIARVTFWAILALVIIWLVWQSTNLLSRYFYTLRRDFPQPLIGFNQTKIKSLGVSGWLGLALQFEQQRNYRDACLCLYCAMLQLLDDRGIAPQEESRTDGEYLRLVSYLPQWLSYQTLIMTHQRLCFGRFDASLSLFEECLQAYREIEKV